MKLFIKNMVCRRCKMAVEGLLKNEGWNPISVELGEVQLEENLSANDLQKLDIALRNLGFELIDDRRSRLIEQIKNTVVDWIHYREDEWSVTLSSFLADKLHYDYNYLSNLFTSVEGITIEKYVIAQKMEKVKELLTYDEMTLSTIADKLGYSSTAYLSNQFKKETGMTPSQFKSLKEKTRQNLDDL